MRWFWRVCRPASCAASRSESEAGRKTGMVVAGRRAGVLGTKNGAGSGRCSFGTNPSAPGQRRPPTRVDRKNEVPSTEPRGFRSSIGRRQYHLRKTEGSDGSGAYLSTVLVWSGTRGGPAPGTFRIPVRGVGFPEAEYRAPQIKCLNGADSYRPSSDCDCLYPISQLAGKHQSIPHRSDNIGHPVTGIRYRFSRLFWDLRFLSSWKTHHPRKLISVRAISTASKFELMFDMQWTA